MSVEHRGVEIQAETVADSAALKNEFAPRIENGKILLANGLPTRSAVVEPMSVEWNGRTYHGYDEGAYLLPNDALEQKRLDFQHAMFTLLLAGKFGLAPLKQVPQKVLDIATGTGIWPLEFARQHPSSHVVGTDLSLIQPHADLLNCKFIRENSETSVWSFPFFFDYIHCRYSTLCFDDVSTVFQKAYDYLQPGGYVEFFDVDCEVQFEGETGKGSGWESYGKAVKVGMESLGRDPYKSRRYKELLEQAGFVNVAENISPQPFSPWMQDEKLRLAGMLGRTDAKMLFRGGIHQLLMKTGLSKEEVSELLGRCVTECDECKVHFWFDNYVVHGRKPFQHEMTEPQKAGWKVMQQKVAELQKDAA